MVYTSINFLIFCVLLIILYYTLLKKHQSLLLLVASIGFYIYTDISSFLIIFIMSTITYIVSSELKYHKKIIISTGILHIVLFILNRYADIYVLGFTFKNIASIGLSFTMFKSIGYLIDSYKNEAIKCNYLEFLLYEINFLEIVQGPISCCQDWVNQICIQHQWSWKRFYTGILMILHGLVMKLIIANRLLVPIDCIKNDLSYQGAYVLFVIFAYSVYIYTDFSGGITIIRGIGTLLGIEIDQNFQQPYLSTSVSEFWKRWHMSLNKWFTKYIYIPLGGSKQGKQRTVINILIIYLISGVWHGATFNYIVWGLLNALCVIYERYGKNNKKEIFSSIKTFVIISILWMFFYYPSVMDVVRQLMSIFTNINYIEFVSAGWKNIGLSFVDSVILIVSILSLYIIDKKYNVLKITCDKLIVEKTLSVKVIILVLVFMILIFGVYGVGYNATNFIYGAY